MYYVFTNLLSFCYAGYNTTIKVSFQCDSVIYILSIIATTYVVLDMKLTTLLLLHAGLMDKESRQSKNVEPSWSDEFITVICYFFMSMYFIIWRRRFVGVTALKCPYLISNTLVLVVLFPKHSYTCYCQRKNILTHVHMYLHPGCCISHNHHRSVKLAGSMKSINTLVLVVSLPIYHEGISNLGGEQQ